MIIQALAFYLFAFIAIAAGVMVISTRNPVHSVLFLILAFFNSAGLFVLMGAEFLAMILVVVYVGAVAVLKSCTHLPVIVDPSHAAGRRDLVVPLAFAAAAVGADGLIVEAHPNPDEALCDKEQALRAEDLERLTAGLIPILKSQGRDL